MSDTPERDIMTFESALSCLRQGVKVRRESWVDEHILSLDLSVPAIVDQTGNHWTPETTDLFADDWEVV
jgi:hypothetical protein